jgi:hypothetical protein
MVESSVPSLRIRQQLISYISQLQMNAYTNASKTNSDVTIHHQNETIQLRVSLVLFENKNLFFSSTCSVKMKYFGNVYLN